MTFNDGIYIQYKIIKRIKLLSILSDVRGDIESHDKKENKKKNTISHRNKINIKKERIKKPRTKLLKRTINISKRQE